MSARPPGSAPSTKAALVLWVEDGTAGTVRPGTLESSPSPAGPQLKRPRGPSLSLSLPSVTRGHQTAHLRAPAGE